MGCDGGTIPRRDELIRQKKKPEQKDKESVLGYRWKYCSIKQMPLQKPIVACSLGRLYSKESVLEGLLDRSTLPETAEHIKNLKDVKNLELTPNPEFDGSRAHKSDNHGDNGRSPFICPIIGLEMNGRYRFCFLWSCGCVMSERAMKELKSSVCLKCQKPFNETDVIIMNAEGEDLKKMEENSVLRKAEKKSKKKRPVEEAESTEVQNKKIKNIKKEEKVGSSKTASKVAKAEDPAYEKASGSYSIAKDPKATEVLKSLFTTHEDAAKQDRAHWVTYNPFYN